MPTSGLAVSHLGIRRTVWVIGLLAALAVCAPAQAATLVVEPYPGGGGDAKILRYSGTGVEQNRLVVTEDASAVTFSDPGAIIEPGVCASAGAVATCPRDRLPRPLFLEVQLGDGDDTARADIAADGAFHNPDVPWLPFVRMIGGAGSDELVGSDLPGEHANSDWLSGGADADRLIGRGGSDSLDGGAGGDRLDGGAGLDMLQGRGSGAYAADDADTFLGGDGADRVDYGYQSDPPPGIGGPGGAIVEALRVTGDGEANDGAPGEGDNVAAGIEAVYLGNGDDYVRTGGDLRGAHGGPGNDEMHSGNSTWPGGIGLQGGPGDDVLMGSAEPDALGGHEGNDRIVGGPGRDTITGDEGDDWIDARDPPPAPGNPNGPNDGHDWVMCGTGHDEIYPDESEVRSMAAWDGCELVHAPPMTGAPPPPAGGVPPAIPSLARSGTASLERVTVVLSCSRGTGECRGDLVLKTSAARTGTRKAAKGVVLARGKFAAKPGKSKRIALPLTKSGRAVLRRSSRVEARASLTPRTAGGKTLSRSVVVKRRR